MCALVTNESAVSKFNTPLRVYNDHDHISYITLKMKLHFPCLHQTLNIYSYNGNPSEFCDTAALNWDLRSKGNS